MRDGKVGKMSWRAAGLVVLLVALAVAGLAACSSSAPKVAGSRIKPTWIKADVKGEAASLSVDEVVRNVMSHFSIGTDSGDMAFMAYEFGGTMYVRADICPPCRSQSFSLKNDTLVCDSCGTVFDARTGAGKSGACVAYPKQPVPYQVSDGRAVMQGSDLLKAYVTTAKPVRS